MNVRLISITPDAEKTMIYVARVSNPKNQENPEYSRLIKYCIDHQHWSIFEQAFITLEIETSRAISAQIIRHKSFSFQEFSQRYSDVFELGFEPIYLRKQAEKNRQSSSEELGHIEEIYFQTIWNDYLTHIQDLYKEMLDAGVAKECARMILPMCTTTRLYMSGTIRSWIHYLQLRTQPDTQLEHRQVALEAQKIFVEQLPTVAKALGWKE